MGEEEPTQTPHDLAYSNDHLWARRDGGEALLGVTAFACDQLGEIVYVELPEAGTVLHQDEPFGVIESVKSVSDLFAPVSGLVVERNDAAVGCSRGSWPIAVWGRMALAGVGCGRGGDGFVDGCDDVPGDVLRGLSRPEWESIQFASDGRGIRTASMAACGGGSTVEGCEPVPSL